MIALLFSSVLAGLLALLLYQMTAYPFFWVDLIYYFKLQRHKKTLKARMQQGITTFLDCFLHEARKRPNKPFIIFENQTLTYQDVDKRSNQFASAFRTEGSLKQGDIVALLMCNEPDFICVWFGLCKLGCEVAFLNVNIKAKSLLHCLRSCGAKTLVVGADLVCLAEEVLPDLKKDNVGVWVVAHTSPDENFKSLLLNAENMSDENLSDLPKVDVMSNFLFIFTSGTTGLPKAARVGHMKAIGSMIFFDMCGARSDDVIYITLPLYHMSASLLGIGGCIHLGATCVLKRRFSVNQFWKDCVKHNVTVVQYIGELCRYLLNQPMVAEERAHCVRLAAGSGLRSDVWRQFITRFEITKVREGYGLTEANIGFLNYTDEVGPIGRASCFNKLLVPFKLLRYDPKTYEPLRSASGRCMQAQIGEAGILVTPLTAANQFLGYAGNKVQSEKKLIRDVFIAGDVYFNTGDLLVQDHRDFLYFRDRIGDTFRWKGENVSTTEVSEVLGVLDFIQEANIYGVTIPDTCPASAGHGNDDDVHEGRTFIVHSASHADVPAHSVKRECFLITLLFRCEGRAGMAAVVLKPDQRLHGKKLYNHLVKTLPAYAWPWFLRVQTSLDVTETFKQQKTKLVQEGFNPDVIHDPLYFLDVSQKDYALLTLALYQDIVSGKISL